MTYRVLWDKGTTEDFRVLGKALERIITAKVDSYLSQSPLKLGKPLRGSFRGLYKYRIGKCRVIYEVDAEVGIITILSVGFRKDVYRD